MTIDKQGDVGPGSHVHLRSGELVSSTHDVFREEQRNADRTERQLFI